MTKKLMTAALSALLMTCWAAGTAQAQADDSDSMTITITPNVDYGVEIDTTNTTLDLGTVDLYAATQMVDPATVTILGTVSSDGTETTGQELDLALSFGGTGPWSVDATPSTDATSGSIDELAVYALFSDTELSAPPDGDEFAAESADFTSASGHAGSATNNGTDFEYTQAANARDMDHLSVDEKAHLWMFFRLPPSTTNTGAKTVTLTATAVGAS